MLSKIIKQADIDHFAKWFERAEKIVIVSHISPDGDAIGSSLGLWHFLSSQDKTANVIVPNAFPDFLKWMPGSKDILLYDKYKDFADRLIAEADVICCLDPPSESGRLHADHYFTSRNLVHVRTGVSPHLPDGLFQ